MQSKHELLLEGEEDDYQQQLTAYNDSCDMYDGGDDGRERNEDTWYEECSLPNGNNDGHDNGSLGGGSSGIYAVDDYNEYNAVHGGYGQYGNGSGGGGVSQYEADGPKRDTSRSTRVYGDVWPRGQEMWSHTDQIQSGKIYEGSSQGGAGDDDVWVRQADHAV